MILEKITKKNNRIMSFYEGKIPIINSVSHAFPCVLSNPQGNEKFPCVPCQIRCVFYLTHIEMRNFSVCIGISLCVLPKLTRKCAFPCVCMKKPSANSAHIGKFRFSVVVYFVCPSTLDQDYLKHYISSRTN